MTDRDNKTLEGEGPDRKGVASPPENDEEILRTITMVGNGMTKTSPERRKNLLTMLKIAFPEAFTGSEKEKT